MNKNHQVKSERKLVNIVGVPLMCAICEREDKKENYSRQTDHPEQIYAQGGAETNGFSNTHRLEI